MKNKVPTKFICNFKLLLKHKFSDTCTENISLLEIRVQASFFFFFQLINFCVNIIGCKKHFKSIIVVVLILHSFLFTPCFTQYLSGINEFLAPTFMNTWEEQETHEGSAALVKARCGRKRLWKENVNDYHLGEVRATTVNAWRFINWEF